MREVEEEEEEKTKKARDFKNCRKEFSPNEKAENYLSVTSHHEELLLLLFVLLKTKASITIETFVLRI